MKPAQIQTQTQTQIQNKQTKLIKIRVMKPELQIRRVD